MAKVKVDISTQVQEQELVVELALKSGSTLQLSLQQQGINVGGCQEPCRHPKNPQPLPPNVFLHKCQ
jgi:hypothetical protein